MITEAYAIMCGARIYTWALYSAETAKYMPLPKTLRLCVCVCVCVCACAHARERACDARASSSNGRIMRCQNRRSASRPRD